MQRGDVDVVIVGADRVASNGDVCNKIGTYDKALAARDNNVPFYVALPSPTIDWGRTSGDAIPIEARDTDEVLTVAGRDDYGQTVRVAIAPHGTKAVNYAFDVTPARLVTGLVTERGITRASQGMAGRDVSRTRGMSAAGSPVTRAARVARGGDRHRARDERSGNQPRQVGQRQRAPGSGRIRRLPRHAERVALRRDHA